MIYSKTLHPDDYDKMSEPQHIDNIWSMIGNIGRNEHPHRRWEYGLTLNLLRKENVKTVLDVGGGGSVFAPAAAWLDMEVTQVDPGDCSEWVRKQSEKIGKPLIYIQQDFMDYKDRKKYDAVVCLSTIEHVPDDFSFFRKLLTFLRKGGLLVLTTDFHPEGPKAFADGHIRTYDETMLKDFINLASKRGFELYGEFDYSHFNTYVNNYTFASLALKRVR